MANQTKRTHKYHAESTAVSGKLEHPLTQTIEPQSHVKLNETGGYLSERAELYRAEGVISFKHAYTQVTGNPDPKPGHGWATLSTAVVEGLNVLEVLTCDRVVAQIGTEHPLEGYTPTVTFLGTRFENLRIAGYPIHVELNLEFVGDKPAEDAPYMRHAPFLQRLDAQHQALRQHADIPAEITQRYNRVPASNGNLESIECSLVKKIEGSFPGRAFGHVLDVPHFGKIHLATLRLDHADPAAQTGIPKETTFKLNMFELEMGCIGTGRAMIGSPINNGSTYP